MARVPTWTEVFLDVISGATLQRECHENAHLLYSALPKLDQRLMLLTGEQQTNTQCPLRPEQKKQLLQHSSHQIQPSHKRLTPCEITQQRDNHQDNNHDNYHHLYLQEQQIHQHQLNSLSERLQQLEREQFKQLEQEGLKQQPQQHQQRQQRQQQQQQIVVDEQFIDQQTNLEHRHFIKQHRLIDHQQILERQKSLIQQQHRSPSPIHPTANSSSVDVEFVMHDPIYVPQYHEVNPEPPKIMTPQCAPQSPKGESALHAPTRLPKVSKPQPFSIPQNELDINNLEYLKPPPMPLRKYFERSRVFRNVAERDMLIKAKTERRKELANRLINSLERIRLSSRRSTSTLTSNYNYNSNNENNKYDRFRQANQNNNAHDYRHKYKLSEYEIRRLTAKNYKRLPEVKKRCREEANRYMKIQYHKNKLEFARTLSENRRRGIINYPVLV